MGTELDSRRLEIRLLGSCQALVDGEPVSLGGRQPRTILALLALSVGTTISTERIIDAIWGSSPPSGAANTVQVYVSRLRRTLQPDGAPPVLRSGPGGYLLDLASDAVDVLQFEHLARVGHERLAAGDAAEALSLLTEALALWRGPALDDVEQVTPGGLLTRLEAHRLAAQVDRIDSEIALGRFGRAVPELEELIREHPLDEGLVARLMTVLYLSGRQGDALASYADAVRRLSDELGVDPGPHLRQVHAEVLRHELTVPETVANRPVSSSGSRTVDITDDLPSPTISDKTSTRRLEELRRPRGVLVGRQSELDQVMHLLGDPSVRVVTLLGPGGMGKTRLAIAIADAINVEPAPTGTAAPQPRSVLVPLSTVTDHGEMLAAIARATGTDPLFAGQDVFDVVLRGLGDQPTVLVLDNLEQLVENAGPVDELIALLDRLPLLTLLGTSRTALRLQDEHLVPIGPLAVPDVDDDAQAIAQSDAVQLFVDRARSAVPGFAVTADNAGAIGQLCRMLDGQPLALELAAARTRMLPPEEMVRRTGRLLHLLTGGGRDMPERQRSMRAALDWSANLLDPAEASVFAQLSVFTGGWTIDAAESVCTADEEVFDVLTRLLDKSLIVADRDGRLSMLETVREYAAEQLESPTHHGPASATMWDRHIHFFAEFAEELGPLCRDSPDPTTRAMLDADAANITAALEHAFVVGESLVIGRIVTALLDYWFFSGRIAQRERWLPIADAADLPNGERARLLLAAASLAFVQGDVERAATRFVPAFAAAQELGDKPLMARAMKGISLVARHTGDLDAALQHIDESIALIQASFEEPDSPVLRQILPLLENERGEVLDGLGRCDEARVYYERYRRFASTDMDSSHLGWALANVALNECEFGDPETAREFEAAALRASDDGDSAPGRGDVRGSAAVVELTLGDPLRAGILLVDAIRFTHSTGQLLTLPDLVSLLGAALLQTGQPAMAARMLMAGESWREVRGLAVVGRLARQQISQATAELGALPLTEEIRAERARGAAAPFGWIEPLELPTTVDIRDREPQPTLRLVGQRDSGVKPPTAAERAALAARD